MRDLDKAIRAELETNYWRASRANSIAADRGARAILSTLDLHTHTEVPGLPMRQCAACGLISRDQWCDTVNAIADDLGVSGEDRSEPTPAPREFHSPDDVPRFLAGSLRTRGGSVYGRHYATNEVWWRKAGDGEPADDRGFACDSPIGLDAIPASEWPLTEVVTPEGTS